MPKTAAADLHISNINEAGELHKLPTNKKIRCPTVTFKIFLLT